MEPVNFLVIQLNKAERSTEDGEGAELWNAVLVILTIHP